jgi:hypothetical protein
MTVIQVLAISREPLESISYGLRRITEAWAVAPHDTPLMRNVEYSGRYDVVRSRP